MNIVVGRGAADTEKTVTKRRGDRLPRAKKKAASLTLAAGMEPRLF
jgi:hypothetical protein